MNPADDYDFQPPDPYWPADCDDREQSGKNEDRYLRLQLGDPKAELPDPDDDGWPAWSKSGRR